MKSISIVSVALLASMGLAQNLSDCATGCIERVIQIRQEKCGGDNVDCVCDSPNLVDGIRDCTTEACSSKDTEAAIASGTSICKKTTPSGTETDSTTGTATSTDGSAPTSDDATGTSVTGTGLPTGSEEPTGTETGVSDETSIPYSTVLPTTAVETSGSDLFTSTFAGTTLYTYPNGTATSTGIPGTGTSGSATGTGTETESESSSATGDSTETDSDSNSPSATESDDASATESEGADGENAASRATTTFGIAGALGLMAMFAL